MRAIVMEIVICIDRVTFIRSATVYACSGIPEPGIIGVNFIAGGMNRVSTRIGAGLIHYENTGKPVVAKRDPECVCPNGITWRGRDKYLGRFPISRPDAIAKA